MAKPKSITTIKKEMEARGESLGNYKSIAQKLAMEKKLKGGVKKATIKGDIQRKRVVKEFLKCNDIKQTAKTLGMSYPNASRYVNSDKALIMFKEVFSEIGLDKEAIAKITKEEFLEYNKQKVTRSDAGGRAVEEMRDGKLAFKALQFAADKIEPTKQEIEVNYNVDINSNTASLAVKQLINQINDVEVLKELLVLVEARKISCSVMIEVN
tara:strand:- start:45662 stop:46294 length:633 start_codon:yes stop_codon:yes gene_type:complete